ncbi:hypothetical protein CDL12_09046 [Handroanthus impetiginosus]|uniref:Growth-regulating factor n=1 Tax=Handroanthus impetiginosus TaxID=429701 RepID=A0A2G9HL89_9LAMI|nr:hypothetical protein CDL12_09046 [Handroanthus impetiginosus]
MEAPSPPCKISRVIQSGKATAARVKHGFTWMQLQELELQSLIYNYIKAGIPVPTHLILPIWRSFAGCIAHQIYPNCLGYNPLYFDPKSSMDPEPRRCRRTDGKKWRCSRNVVEGQKYCSSHMHRGRLRPRNNLQPPPAATAAEETCSTNKFSSTNLSIPCSSKVKRVTQGYDPIRGNK